MWPCQINSYGQRPGTFRILYSDLFRKHYYKKKQEAQPVEVAFAPGGKKRMTLPKIFKKQRIAREVLASGMLRAHKRLPQEVKSLIVSHIKPQQ
jgi:hypothetical protein